MTVCGPEAWTGLDRLFPLGGKRQASHTEWQSVRDGTRANAAMLRDQYAADGSQNKMLTAVSPRPEEGSGDHTGT